MLRPGIAGMRGPMVIRLWSCMTVPPRPPPRLPVLISALSSPPSVSLVIEPRPNVRASVGVVSSPFPVANAEQPVAAVSGAVGVGKDALHTFSHNSTMVLTITVEGARESPRLR